MNVVGTKTAKLMRNLEKTVEKLRTKRNIAIHSEHYSDDELRLLEGYAIIIQNSDEEHITRHFKYLADDYVKDKKKDLSRINEDVFTQIRLLLTELCRIVEHQLSNNKEP